MKEEGIAIKEIIEIPVDRRQLVVWLMTLKTDSVEELRDCLLRRLDDAALRHHRT
jgi:hypothetical protein